ncbi:MAG: putative ABC transporter permease [Lachnospiraceae bacterium]|nr:putative ABC transporter permease [Lachnospiraceae bacterium]
MSSLSTFEAGFLIITFLFMVGSMFGWVLELFFRRFISTKNPSRKWINPGFLVGPCLPLYGFGLTLLFIMSLMPYVGHDGAASITAARVFWAIIAMGILMTVIEYIAGLIFIRGMKIKLWDYSDEWGNIQGIICPKFSIIWTVLAALYYFFVQPYVIRMVQWFSDNIAFSFVVGMFYGIFIIDLVYSLNIVGKVRRFAVENDVVVKYETLKQEIRSETDMLKKRGRFILAFNPERELKNVMEESLERIRFVKIPRKKDNDGKRS